LLAMALNHMGYKAISLSGAQAGIKTDSAFRKARIAKVEATYPAGIGRRTYRNRGRFSGNYR
jgi:aspartate kinase